MSRARLLASFALAAAFSLIACSGNNSLSSMMANSAAERAMAELPESVKATATQYTGGLSQLIQILMNVRSTSDALTSVRTLEPLVTQVTKASSDLKALDPVTKQNVLTAYASDLKTNNDAFTTQLNRIRGDASGSFGSMGSILGPALDRISLFK